MTAPAAYSILTFSCATPTVNNPAWYRLNKQVPHVYASMPGRTPRMGVTRANPPFARPTRGNYGAEIKC